MSSGCYISYNGSDFDYVDPSIAYAGVYDNAALVGYNVTISWRSFHSAASLAARTTLYNNIVAALSVPKQTLTIKDPSGTTMHTFSSSSYIGGDGPNVDFTIDKALGFSFYVSATASGQIAAAGTGTISDSYEDAYSYDKQGRITYTRSGSRRNASAYSTADAAATDTDPSPSGEWELQSKDIRLDEDKKVCNYTFVYVETFEDAPSQFVDFEYNISKRISGQSEEWTISASAGIDFDSGSKDNIEDDLRKWAEGQVPKNGKIQSVSPSVDPRNGRGSISISAVAPIGDDIVESSESTTYQTVQDYIVRKQLGGGGAFKMIIGDPDVSVAVSGYKVGLNSHPSVDTTGADVVTVYHDPQKGPDGDLLYRVDYSYSYPIIGGGGGGTPTGGGGSSGGGVGSPPSSSSGFGQVNTSPPTGGSWISRATGGFFGERSGFSSFSGS